MNLRLLFCLLIFCAATFARAQNVLSVNATGTLGFISNEVQLGADYKFGRFSLGMGVAYGSSFYLNDTISQPYPNSNNYNKQLSFSHLIMPITLGFHMPMGNRVFFIPMVSLGVSYNTRAKYMSWTDHYDNLYERRLTQPEFEHNFRRVSVWAGLGIRFAYKISERFYMLGSIQGRYMLLPISKSDPEIRAGAGGLALGLQYNFVSY